MIFEIAKAEYALIKREKGFEHNPPAWGEFNFTLPLDDTPPRNLDTDLYPFDVIWHWREWNAKAIEWWAQKVTYADGADKRIYAFACQNGNRFRAPTRMETQSDYKWVYVASGVSKQTNKLMEYAFVFFLAGKTPNGDSFESHIKRITQADMDNVTIRRTDNAKGKNALLADLKALIVNQPYVMGQMAKDWLYHNALLIEAVTGAQYNDDHTMHLKSALAWWELALYQDKEGRAKIYKGIQRDMGDRHESYHQSVLAKLDYR